jgi:hypothetical protein
VIAASATDARDAFVIADAARTLPHTLRRVGPDEQAVAALGVLAGYDADLASEATRQTNQLHDALLQRPEQLPRERAHTDGDHGPQRR